MRIAIPREIAPGERRVALTPDMVARLIKGGHSVAVQSGAGDRAGRGARTPLTHDAEHRLSWLRNAAGIVGG